MATDIEICSNAFVRLGAPPISSFSEGGAQGIAAANLYEPTLRALLTEHRWRFAAAKRQLAQLTSTPLNEYDYAYQLPSDMLVMYRMTPGTDYQIFEDKLYTNASEVEIDYLMRPQEAIFPAYFQLALEFRLASEFALSVTGNRSLSELNEIKATEQLKKARFADSQQTPSVAVQSLDYLTVRN